jgi:uridine kinase
VLAFRPEYNEFWDFRIWLEVSPELSLRRGIDRDTTMEGLDEATLLHRDRYHVAESIYVAEVNPHAAADVVIDNSTQLETNLGALGLHLTAEETTLLGRLVFGAAC